MFQVPYLFSYYFLKRIVESLIDKKLVLCTTSNIIILFIYFIRVNGQTGRVRNSYPSQPYYINGYENVNLTLKK